MMWLICHLCLVLQIDLQERKVKTVFYLHPAMHHMPFVSPIMTEIIRQYVNNKGADQPVHMSSLISAFDVSCIYGLCQANLVLIAYASSKGSGEPAHPRSLARTSAARSYKQ